MDRGRAVDAYRTMLLIRHFEEMLGRLFAAAKVPGFIHLYVGQEGVAAGVCAALTRDDYVFSTHRGHGHCLAKGADPRRVMAEIFGRVDGYCRGRGGSMHVAAAEVGVLGANGIVGGSLPLAVGAAFGAHALGDGRVAVGFFGDGAANTGAFHEAANLAAVWQLPVLLVCENNQYAEFTPQSAATRVDRVATRAIAYDLPALTVDGNDVESVNRATQEAVARARAGGGPTLLECLTYRWRGHHEGDPQTYRAPTEVDDWRVRDPIARWGRTLVERGWASDDDLAAADRWAETTVAEAVRFAEASPVPDPATERFDPFVSV